MLTSHSCSPNTPAHQTFCSPATPAHQPLLLTKHFCSPDILLTSHSCSSAILLTSHSCSPNTSAHQPFCSPATPARQPFYSPATPAHQHSYSPWFCISRFVQLERDLITSLKSLQLVFCDNISIVSSPSSSFLCLKYTIHPLFCGSLNLSLDRLLNIQLENDGIKVVCSK